MELEHSFTVPVPPEQAWQVLLDVERVAPCMPGATVDSVDGDVVKGRIKVRVGPVALTYAGTARFIERDDKALSITLEASGKETRGSGTASAKVRSSLRNESGQTTVVVYTTLSVTGRPAQFGRGVMAEVSGKIIQQFADNLAAQLAGGNQPADKPAAGQSSGGASPGDRVVPGAGSPGTARPSDTSSALPIEELHLPVRAFNSLRRAGIHTVGDLSARSEEDLLAIENLGPQSVKEIKTKLVERGAQLSATMSEASQRAATSTNTASQGVAADSDRASAAPAPASTGTAGGASSATAAGTAAGGAGSASAAGTAAGAPATGHASIPAGPSAATAPPKLARPADQDVIDLLNVAGVPVLKRALPLVGGVATVLFVVFRLRRSRGRHRSRR